MSLILAWGLFPLVLGAVGLGWGALTERASSTALDGALLIPLGLATALVVAGTVTASSTIAPAAVTVVAAGGVVGLVLAWRGRRWPGGWPLLAALGVLLVYGAPVLASGHATFTGYIKLDDTATWFNVIDNVMGHGRSVAQLPPSTYRLNFETANPAYPLGAFMLPGVGRALTGIDIAWVFQPYLACCAAALAMCLHALMAPLIASARLRAVLAFLGAQASLLYGYSLWGGIKELTAAFLLALGATLAAALLRERPPSWRALIPLALAAGALIQTLGVGAAGWIAAALLALAAGWLVRRRGARERRAGLVSLGWAAALTAVAVIPLWVVLSDFLSNQGNLIDQLFSSGQSTHTKLGNLYAPLKIFQLAGIWPVGDFRLTAPTIPSALWIGLTLLAAAGALFVSIRRRRFGIPFYVGVALVGCAVVYLSGGTPWVTAKAMALSSPALLAAALAGGGVLFVRRHLPGALVIAALAGGVLWSDALAYHNVTLAPRASLAELQQLGKLVAGRGPTFINQYEVYADRHFLREGAPVEPAEYRSVTLPLRNGIALTDAAWADLDSFPLSTLEPYRSVVTRRSPVESRPPSTYRLAWQGTYYQLWRRPAQPETTIVAHVPLGESLMLPYCGRAQDGPYQPLCSINPVAIPPCSRIEALGRRAASVHGQLVAYQRPAPIVARGDQMLWPAGWLHETEEHTLVPTFPGTATSHIAVASSEPYELWLGGSFARGFEVSVDGRHLGTVRNQLQPFAGYVYIATLFLESGVHTIQLTYPHSSMRPGSAWGQFTYLEAIALEPTVRPPRALIAVAPAQARRLCGRELDWVEIVRRTA
ncbi:MAG TPA: hypothetical protein VLZ06_02530 [Solirubrobacteraceae bacterium]|nr:hypothetical protein [Solirubrobacteraceae bacterium]